MVVGDRGLESAVMVRGVNQEELHWSQWVWWRKRMMPPPSKVGPPFPSLGYGTVSLFQLKVRESQGNLFSEIRGAQCFWETKAASGTFWAPKAPWNFTWWKKSANLMPIWYPLHLLLLIAYAFSDRHALFHLFHSIWQCCSLHGSIKTCYHLDPQLCALPHLFIPLTVLEVFYTSPRSCSLSTITSAMVVGGGRRSKRGSAVQSVGRK